VKGADKTAELFQLRGSSSSGQFQWNWKAATSAAGRHSHNVLSFIRFKNCLSAATVTTMAAPQLTFLI